MNENSGERSVKKPNYRQAVDATRKILEIKSKPEPWSAGFYDVLLDQVGPPIEEARLFSMLGHWAELIEQAKTDRTLFDGMKHLVAEMLDDKKELPAELSNWFANFLRGNERAPRKKSGPRFRDNQIRQLIYELVQELIRDGFTQKRAFQIVADAGRGLDRIPIDAESVRKVHTAWREHVKNIMNSAT